MQKIFSFITKTVDSFRLNQEKEDFHVIAENIDSGVVFKGTNLWILVFAILICSLGLNVNSTAVVIGAMLVSPLMGPIIGLGFGIATSDIALLKKALYNYLFAGIVAIVASTLYFALTPIHVAQTEMLARTSPNIYDVLIAFFGGLAGIVAIASKMKGNVIPGVAIATALMPPLCTAGYGLATLQWNFFLGAFYLFFINTVFISLATLLTARLLKFPQKEQLDEKLSKRTNRIILFITILTIVPSIYFGYTMVQQDRYMQKALRFVKSEIAKHPTKNSFLKSKQLFPSTSILSFFVFTTTFSISDKFESLKFCKISLAIKSASQFTPHDVVTELSIDLSNCALFTPGTSNIKFLYISIFLFFSIFISFVICFIYYPIDDFFRWGKTYLFCLISLRS